RNQVFSACTGGGKNSDRLRLFDREICLAGSSFLADTLHANWSGAVRQRPQRLLVSVNPTFFGACHEPLVPHVHPFSRVAMSRWKTNVGVGLRDYRLVRPNRRGAAKEAE